MANEEKESNRKKFSNWLQCVNSLNETKTALHDHVLEIWKKEILSLDKDLRDHLSRFLICVSEDTISYKEDNKGKRNRKPERYCKCEHTHCNKILKLLLSLQQNPGSHIIWNNELCKQLAKEYHETEPVNDNDDDMENIPRVETSMLALFLQMLFAFLGLTSRKQDAPAEVIPEIINYEDIFDGCKQEHIWCIANMFMHHGKGENKIANTGPGNTDASMFFRMMKNCRLFEIEDQNNLYDEVQKETILSVSVPDKTLKELSEKALKLKKTALEVDRETDRSSGFTTDESNGLLEKTTKELQKISDQPSGDLSNTESGIRGNSKCTADEYLRKKDPCKHFENITKLVKIHAGKEVMLEALAEQLNPAQKGTIFSLSVPDKTLNELSEKAFKLKKTALEVDREMDRSSGFTSDEYNGLLQKTTKELQKISDQPSGELSNILLDQIVGDASGKDEEIKESLEVLCELDKHEYERRREENAPFDFDNSTQYSDDALSLVEKKVSAETSIGLPKTAEYKATIGKTSGAKRQAGVESGHVHSPPCETLPKKPLLGPGLQLPLPNSAGEVKGETLPKAIDTVTYAPGFDLSLSVKDKSMAEAHEGDIYKSKDSNVEDLRHDVADNEMFKGLNEKGLLDSAELNKLCSSEGKASSNIKKECEKICAAIKAESDQIVHVFPAYKLTDEAKVVFVVFATREIKLHLPWTLEVRIVHEYSDESRIAMYCDENVPLSTETSRTIGDIIDKYSVNLMRYHTYLTAISASSVVFKHYGTTTQSIVPTPCIVLSVLVKHFIPINEEPLPTTLDGITVDVREGGVRFCGGSAGDFHDQVRMGCKITSSFLPQQFGTLGGFVEHPEYGLCGFTCAHVILNDKKKQYVKGKENVKKKDLKELGPVFEIFQPFCDPRNRIGRVVEFIYRDGNDDKTGVDLALFKIEQRPPTDGNFPDNRGTSTPIKYESGKVWGKEGIPTHQLLVQKFGSVTGLTFGQIQFDGAVVKEIPFHSKMETDTVNLTTTLYKQYHIKSNDMNVRFSELGDSGALVFMSDGFDQEDDLRCIGMVEGIWNDNTCAVTPITAILEELKVTQLKSFTPIVTWKKIDARLSEMEERIMRAIARGNTNAHNPSQ